MSSWLPRRARVRPAAGTLHRVTLVTRAGCHLCEVAEADLVDLGDELGFTLHRLDVDADPELRRTYADLVPVVLVDGREHGFWRVDGDRLRAALSS